MESDLQNILEELKNKEALDLDLEHYYFNIKFDPSLANFYAFFTSIVFKATKPSTTVNGFLLQLK